VQERERKGGKRAGLALALLFLTGAGEHRDRRCCLSSRCAALRQREGEE
jgi:hypothetical protein